MAGLRDTLSLTSHKRLINIMAFANGLAWGLLMVFGARYIQPLDFALLAMLTGGMMGAAIISYGPLPSAALSYLVPLTVSCVTAWLLSPLPLAFQGVALILCYAAVLTRTILANRDIFVAKVESELALQEKANALRESSETVQLLLNDYEAQSADWLWSVDEDGAIAAPCGRFADACGRDVAGLEGVQFISLFDVSTSRDTLARYLDLREGFRDLIVQLTVADEPKWWRLSARTRADGRLHGVASDITVEKRAEAKVSYMAHYCALTDLANRFLFNETLTRSIKRLDEGEVAAVLCLDLDQFKSVNDTLGHPIGDKLLCEVARRIELAACEGAMVARLGGDEFAVLIDKAMGIEEVEACALRIIQTIDQPFVLEGMQVMTSTSIGIAIGLGHETMPADLMKKADLALYSAKANGRNRFAHFEPGMDEVARERRELEMDLRTALAGNEFVLYYQPLVSVQSGDTAGYEALIRWNHPTRGLVMPSAFIPLAEETGLVVQIGEWVLREAVAQLKHWPEDVRVSVNLSPAQMRSANLIPMIVNAVANAGINPDRLELEITETMLMQDSEANIAVLRKLHDFGVRIALDDFGTGYSSLNYLRSFPFDKIKIDRCFVESIEYNAESRAIIRAITELAGKLGMVTTAEGVETPHQFERLRQKGCTQVQGYLFSHPVAVNNADDHYRLSKSSVEKISSRHDKIEDILQNNIDPESQPDSLRRVMRDGSA
ncbi:bifunctional diguanylate cyclase/phosphodiesterase [Sphingomonas sp.]|uniref:putative bifunctional diguanylate cyclase/phosphodiesterase n=1 Tax=Sphingomonas sp. TaxID=28214 RepID=UPI001EC4FF14|nr:bifunctional diguanylate cyclase/phosphodiesterase [Sphingomonas sp.]MBX3594564.1 bifunctional diguanylate cyclase/phosphodiesterase [Sphingomonas sp.]